MSGLDILIAKPLGYKIKENLGEKTLQKIEKRLFERYGISIGQSLEDFHKLDDVLREFFGNGAEGLERQILEKVVSVDETKNQDLKWVSIEEPSLAKIILEAFGDDDKNRILNTVLDESRIISDIIEISKIPQTSAYRKVNSLIENGLLIPSGFITTHDGKKVTKYKSVFNNVKIGIEKNKVMVKVQLHQECWETSSIIQVVQSR